MRLLTGHLKLTPRDADAALADQKSSNLAFRARLDDYLKVLGLHDRRVDLRSNFMRHRPVSG